MSKWMETKDGRLIDVNLVDEEFVYGREILEDDFKLHYGDYVKVKKEEVVEDDLLL